jgi:hypothetical protein
LNVLRPLVLGRSLIRLPLSKRKRCNQQQK